MIHLHLSLGGDAALHLSASHNGIVALDVAYHLARDGNILCEPDIALNASFNVHVGKRAYVTADASVAGDDSGLLSLIIGRFGRSAASERVARGRSISAGGLPWGNICTRRSVLGSVKVIFSKRVLPVAACGGTQVVRI